MQFIVGFLRFWGLNLGSWAGAIGGVNYFLGNTDDLTAFFGSHREGMIVVLLLHFSLCAIIYHSSDTKRIAKRAANLLGRQ